MATIDASYFFAELNIAQKSDVAAPLLMFIDEHEETLLCDLLGYELYKAYKSGIEVMPTPDAKWTDIRDGKEYTNRAGILSKWKGLRFTSSGSQIGSITDTIRFLDPIQFKIGDGGALTPAAASSKYVNVLLKGLTVSQFTVHRNNYGFLIPTTHYTYNPDESAIEGSISLAGTDKFNDAEEFTIQIRKQESAETVISAGTKKSPIANYVYWHWMQDQISVSTGTGEKVADNQNAINATAVSKMTRAWNQMVNWNFELIEFLLSNPTDYPEFTNHYGRIPRNILKKQNPLGI